MFRLFLLLFSHSVFLASSCPTEWQPSNTVDGKCYLFVNQKQTWLQAEHYCKNAATDGHLTSITSAFENADIFVYAQQHCDRYWIGLNDIEQTGNFTWIDGLPPKYTNWDAGQPNTADNYQCVSVNGKGNGKWVTEFCGVTNCFFCGSFQSSVTTTASSTTDAGSGPIVGNPTFTFDVSPPVSWTYFTVPTGTTITNHDTTQPKDAYTAKTNMHQSIKQAITSAFYDMQITTPFTVTLTIDDVNFVVVVPSATTPTIVQGLSVGGAVPIIFPTAAFTPTEVTRKTVKVTVNTSVKLPTTQWETFGNNVLVSLAVDAQAIIRSKVVVTGSP